MTRRLLLAAACALAAAVPAAPANAAGCVATAHLPTWRHNFGAIASGSYDCDGVRSWLTVEVCLEVLTENAMWENASCDSGTVTNAASVFGETQGCRYGVYAIRSVATGWSSSGESHSSASLPVPYFCTPL